MAREAAMNVAQGPSEKQFDQGPRRSRSLPEIDWAAAAGFLGQWVFTICVYLFYVLLHGLVGGMLGRFLDLALAWVHRQWIGYGTQAGWVLGAGLAAIGLPLGWVRPDNRKFKTPSPREITRRASARGGIRWAKKRQSATSGDRSDGILTPSDIVKGGGVCGLIGLIFGVLLGMVFMVCLFSLSMSPFAPGGWLDMIDWGTGQGGGGGMSVSTSDPGAMLLALGPALGLGALGLTVGTLCGLFAYVRCLWTVPRDIRARQRRERKAASYRKALPWYVLAIGIVLMSLGIVLSSWTLDKLFQATASHNWPTTEGCIVSSAVDTSEDSDGAPSYSAHVRYEYVVNGVQYAGQRVSFSGFSGGSSARAHETVRRYPPDTEVAVHFDPRGPHRCVLEPGRPQGPLLASGLSLLALVIGFYVLFYWAERRVASRRA